MTEAELLALYRSDTNSVINAATASITEATARALTTNDTRVQAEQLARLRRAETYVNDSTKRS